MSDEVEDYEVEECANQHLVLVSGASSTGKSSSLYPLRNNSRVLYLNCENNKRLPFPNKFECHTITDPYDVYEAFDYAEEDGKDDIDIIVIDTLTFLMEMFESEHVINSTNTMQAWGDYAQFIKRLFSQYIAKSTKTVIVMAHTSNVINEDKIAEVCVQVKGSVMKVGVESFFSTIVSTKKVPLKKIEKSGADNEYLNITEDDEEMGIKYVFQTRLTKDTVNERMRSPIGMWNKKSTYIDNNIAYLVDKLDKYYGEED